MNNVNVFLPMFISYQPLYVNAIMITIFVLILLEHTYRFIFIKCKYHYLMKRWVCSNSIRRNIVITIAFTDIAISTKFDRHKKKLKIMKLVNTFQADSNARMVPPASD